METILSLTGVVASFLLFYLLYELCRGDES